MRTKTLLLALMCLLALGVTACGQRVEPKTPDGKIIPSAEY